MTILFTRTERMGDTVLSRVDSMAKSMNRSRAWVVNRAIEQFLSNGEWFVREVETGRDEANRGEFADQDEVTARYAKWGVNAG